MKKTIRISFEGRSYDVEVEVLNSASAPAVSAPAPVAAAPVAAAPVVAAPAPAPVAAAPVAAGGTEVHSPMMGLVFKIKVKVGDTVAANQEVVVLEAMKMETPVYAPVAGTITAIHIKEQDSVSEGQVLLNIG
jgi:biotin carboxyl carrier protein